MSRYTKGWLDCFHGITERCLGRPWQALLPILALAALLRFYGLGTKQLWVDEIIQALDSNPVGDVRSVLEGVRSEIAAVPLDFLVQHYTARWFGTSEFVLRFHAAFFGLVTVWLLYRLTTLVSDTRTAALSALLFAVFPLHQQYSQEGRPYALLCLVTVTLWLSLLHLLHRRDTASFLMHAGLLTLSWYGHYFTLWIVLSQAAFLILLRRSPDATSPALDGRPVSVRLLLRYGAAVLFSVTCFAPWAAWTLGQTRAESREHFGGALFVHIFREWSGGGFKLSLPLAVLAVLGCLRLYRQGQRWAFRLLLFWAALPVPLILVTLWARGYFFAIRQFLFLTPPLMILVAHGIFELGDATGIRMGRWKQIPSLIVATAVVGLSVAIFLLRLPDEREDLRGAATFLRYRTRENDTVYAPSVERLLSYYFPDIDRRALGAKSDVSKPSLPEGRVFIVETRYMSTRDRELCESLIRPYKATVTPLRGLRVVMIPGPASAEVIFLIRTLNAKGKN